MEVIKLLNQMAELGFLPAMTMLILVCIAIKAVYEFVIQALGVLNIWHKNAEHKEDIEEQINKLVLAVDNINTKLSTVETKINDDNLRNRVTSLEEADEKRSTQLNKISANLDNISKSLNTEIQESRKRTVASARSTLYRLHSEACQNGYTTQASLETFNDLAKIYLECNGNAIFKSKIIPEYLALPLKNDDGTLSIPYTEVNHEETT